ncbi:uncharacterized protein P884DRAFT_269664 [Thermothelomyces heterothallicus CBS 202.75]|uniref:uncharacterized protein n=1 Tax=Thermothelomyces heterothallicus CBS 202.75 TaxID=1149848 RepID=UPI0037422C9E
MPASSAVNASPAHIMSQARDTIKPAAEAEAYIRTLPIRSALYAPGAFMQNSSCRTWPPRWRPGPSPTSRASTSSPNIFAGDRPYHWIDVVADAGKFVRAILADPDKFEVEVLYAGSELATMDELAAKVSRHTGKTVRTPSSICSSFAPSSANYYGPDSTRRLHETVAQVPYKLTTLDEYIAANVKLD